MNIDTTIQVNFNRPLPLFPLAGAILLPHSVQTLHVFEERYKQMVEHSIDRSGQIAMATFASEDWKLEYEGTPDLRPAVCVGQIMQHHRFEDGRFNLLILGICRARIVQLDEPDATRLYRMASLQLLENSDVEQSDMTGLREQLREMLETPTLRQVRGVSKVASLFEKDELPTHALVEVVASAIIEDAAKRYALLAEPDAASRARILRGELRRMDRLIRSAQWQMNGEWPKGLSWN